MHACATCTGKRRRGQLVNLVRVLRDAVNTFSFLNAYFTRVPQVLGMLLRGKSHLINGNILHLTFTLVGTVDSEHENSCIPNPIAFRDLLAGGY